MQKRIEYTQEDVEAIFTGGACHIFALALKEKYPHLQLGILQDKDYTFHDEPAIAHVFCHHNGTIYDVRGKQQAHELITQFRPNKPKFKWDISVDYINQRIGTALCDFHGFYTKLAKNIIDSDIIL